MTRALLVVAATNFLSEQRLLLMIGMFRVDLFYVPFTVRTSTVTALPDFLSFVEMFVLPPEIRPCYAFAYPRQPDKCLAAIKSLKAKSS